MVYTVSHTITETISICLTLEENVVGLNSWVCNSNPSALHRWYITFYHLVFQGSWTPALFCFLLVSQALFARVVTGVIPLLFKLWWHSMSQFGSIFINFSPKLFKLQSCHFLTLVNFSFVTNLGYYFHSVYFQIIFKNTNYNLILFFVIYNFNLFPTKSIFPVFWESVPRFYMPGNWVCFSTSVSLLYNFNVNFNLVTEFWVSVSFLSHVSVHLILFSSYTLQMPLFLQYWKNKSHLRILISKESQFLRKPTVCWKDLEHRPK